MSQDTFANQLEALQQHIERLDTRNEQLAQETRRTHRHLRLWQVTFLLLLLGGGAGILMAQSTPPLTYSGYLEESGQPIDGKRGVVLSLYDAATGGTAQCNVGTVTAPHSVTFVKGRFKVSLPSKCQLAIQQNPNLWVEVQVKDGQGKFQSLARTRLGAVPHAQNAYIPDQVIAGHVSQCGGPGEPKCPYTWPSTNSKYKVLVDRPFSVKAKSLWALSFRLTHIISFSGTSSDNKIQMHIRADPGGTAYPAETTGFQFYTSANPGTIYSNEYVVLPPGNYRLQVGYSISNGVTISTYNPLLYSARLIALVH